MMLFYMTALLSYMKGSGCCTCDVSHMTTTFVTIYVNTAHPYHTSYNPAIWKSTDPYVRGS